MLFVVDLIVYSSLALISARQTINSLEILSLIISSYLYLLCQGNVLCVLKGTLLTPLSLQLSTSEHFSLNSKQGSMLSLTKKLNLSSGSI